MYQQSYLGNLDWNTNLLERVSENLIKTDRFGNEVLGGELFDSVVDTIEKLGMLYLGRDLLSQDSRRCSSMGQMMVKFHYYHWLYDSVACLDAAARVLNARFDLGVPKKKISFNRRLVELILKKDQSLFNFLDTQRQWIDELKAMRSAVIHRESRLVTGGGKEPTLVMDYARLFTPTVDLNRVMLPSLLDEFLNKIDAVCVRVISSVPSPR